MAYVSNLTEFSKLGRTLEGPEPFPEQPDLDISHSTRVDSQTTRNSPFDRAVTSGRFWNPVV